jgi:hypothetical protein
VISRCCGLNETSVSRASASLRAVFSLMLRIASRTTPVSV